MGKPEEPYIRVVVETYIESGSGLHGDIHVVQSLVSSYHRAYEFAFPRRCDMHIQSGRVFWCTLSSPTGRAAMTSFTRTTLGMSRFSASPMNNDENGGKS